MTRQRTGTVPSASSRADASPLTAGGPPTSFLDLFSTAQTPIGAPWAKNCTACDDVIVTAGGYATNTRQTTDNDDAYAFVSTSAFQAPSDNYEVIGVVGGPASAQMEIELLLRLTDNPGGYFCYEVLVNTSGGSQLVTINGGIGGGYLLWDGNNGTVNTNVTISGWTGVGDRIKARVTGTNPVVITVWHAPAASPNAWVQLYTVSDALASRKQSGQPGIGLYAANAGAVAAWGWDSFSVVAV